MSRGAVTGEAEARAESTGDEGSEADDGKELGPGDDEDEDEDDDDNDDNDDEEEEEEEEEDSDTYVCENGCGFSGAYDDVARHERTCPLMTVRGCIPNDS